MRLMTSPIRDLCWPARAVYNHRRPSDPNIL